MKILKALYAAELLLSAGAGASRAGPDGRTYLKGGQGRFGPKGSGPNLRRGLGKGNGGGNNGGGNGPGQGNLERVDSCGGSTPWGFCSASPNVDITIIGAGATTLGAARFIERYNEMNGQPFVTYRILEAEQAFGPSGPNLGRSIASYFIHGAEGNPIYELKYLQEQVRGDRPKISEATAKWNDVKQITCEGEYGDMTPIHCSEASGPTGHQEFSEVKECAREDDKIIGMPTPMLLGDVLNICYDEVRGLSSGTSDWLTDGDKNRIWQTWDYEYAEDPRSTADFSEDPAFTCTGQEKDIYLQEGSKPILLREYQYYGIDRCTCAGATVSTISFVSTEDVCVVDGYCVKIDTETGGPFYTKQVILTPSVGVLARKAIDIEGFDTGSSPTKYKSMMRVFFDPDKDVTRRVGADAPDGPYTDEEYNPLYYVIAFQFSDDKLDASPWDDDFWLINVDFKELDNGADISPRGRCRWWEVWNNKWDDWHVAENNMIACVLTTEDIEWLEDKIASEKSLAASEYSIPTYESGTPDSELDAAITELFKNSIGIAYDIDVPVDCYRCGSPGQDCTCTTNPAINGACTSTGTGSFDPNGQAPDLALDECRYRVFPSKNNTLWYGSWENVNNIDAYSDPGDRSTPGADYENFIAPINHTSDDLGTTGAIHMAGAATCFNYWGFLQGSYYSGIGGAYASLENLGKDPDTFPDDEKLDSNYCSGAVPFSIGNPRAGCNGW